MSQIASAYVLSEGLLKSADEMTARKDWKGKMELLGPKEIRPEYGFSGYVIAVLISFLDERNITFPNKHDYLHLKDAFLVSSERAAALAASIEDLEPQLDDGELASFFSEFTGEGFDAAAEAMRQGLTFLAKGLRSAVEKK